MQSISVDLPTHVPLTHDVDVAVIGGGPGGLGAAVGAARAGARVLLVEHYGFLGGMATAGEVNPFMDNHIDGKSLDSGVFDDWLAGMAEYGGIRRGSRIFDPHAARLAAEDLCLAAGVQLLYHHRAAHVVKNQRHIQALVLHSKSGFTAVRARNYIDCTGDGDVAVLAGCRFEFGEAQSGHGQPMTLCFKLKIDPRDLPSPEDVDNPYQAVMRYRNDIQQAYVRAKEQGRIQCLREDILMFPGVDRDVVHFNTTRVIQKSATDGQQLSEAEVEARRQLRQVWAMLRTDIPIFRQSRIYSMAPQIGVRESRRIVGRHYLTAADFTACSSFPDAVARVRYPIDIHNPSGSGTHIMLVPEGQWYEIPWRCLLPADCDNLAIGSRCISADHAIHSSLRIMPPVCSMGQACGLAAAMASQKQTDISMIDGLELNRALIQTGRNLITGAQGRPNAAPATATVERDERLARTRAKNYSA